jgi:polar amino acid transport system permease protein
MKQIGRSLLPDILILALVLGGLGYVTVSGAEAMNYQWQWYRIPPFLWRVVDGEGFPGPLLRGLLVTLRIAALSAVITLAAGLLTALLRMSPSWAARGLATVYLEIVRNTPILVQIYIFYFVLAPIVGLGRFAVGVLSLSFFEATLAAEVIRGGLLAVPSSQREAARAMGLREHQVLRLVVLPQALPLMLPPLTGVLINLVKHSAIVSVIAIADLATEARNLISDTLMSFEIWLTVAAIYLSITLCLSAAAHWLEARLHRKSARISNPA